MSNFAWQYYSLSFTCSYHFLWPWPNFKVNQLVGALSPVNHKGLHHGWCQCKISQGQDHSKGSDDQNMTVSTILSELLIPWQPNLVWWYIIRSQSVLWKKWITAFRVKVTAKGQNLMFVQMVSSKPSNILFSNLALWFIIMSQSVMKKDWFAISRSRSLQELIW